MSAAAGASSKRSAVKRKASDESSEPQAPAAKRQSTIADSVRTSGFASSKSAILTPASRRCADYIEAALRQHGDSAAELLLRLVDANGVGTEWYCAEPFESYLDGHQPAPKDPDIPWTLYWTSPAGGGAKQAWADIGPMDHDDPDDTEYERAVEDLMDMQKWAKDLYETSNQDGKSIILFSQTRVVPQLSFSQFVLSPLAENAVADAMSLLEPIWKDRVNEHPGTLLHGSTWRELWDEMLVKVENGSKQPLMPQAYEWDRAWDKSDAAMEAANPNSNTWETYRVLFHLAEADRARHQYTLPCPWKGGWSGEEYCFNIWIEVGKPRNKRADEAWQAAIEGENDDVKKSELEDACDIVLAEATNVRPARLPNERPLAKYDRKHIARTLAFDSGILEDGDRWFFKDTLGQGSCGHAGLWVKYNRHGKLVNRIAIKECYEPSDARYLKIGWTDNEPGEAYVNMILNQCEQSGSIIHCHGFRIFEEVNMYRLYLEYCEHGSLKDIIVSHYKSRMERRLDENGQELEHRISTQVLWAIFETLAAALCLMRYNMLPSLTPPEGGRTEFIHRDLKPENIFLTKPHDNFWPAIPTAKIADFGITGKAADPDYTLPGNGATGYMAPECYQYPPGVSTHPIGPQSDVWAAGKIMLSLMQLDPDKVVSKDVFTLTSGTETPCMEVAKQKYPQALTAMVELCLNADPSQRPTANELYDHILVHIASYVGRRDEVPLKLREAGEDEVLMYKPDQYVLWVPPT